VVTSELNPVSYIYCVAQRGNDCLYNVTTFKDGNFWIVDPLIPVTTTQYVEFWGECNPSHSPTRPQLRPIRNLDQLARRAKKYHCLARKSSEMVSRGRRMGWGWISLRCILPGGKSCPHREFKLCQDGTLPIVVGSFGGAILAECRRGIDTPIGVQLGGSSMPSRSDCCFHLLIPIGACHFILTTPP